MIRIAMIGMGQRGQATCTRLQLIRNATVVCTCDRDDDWEQAIQRQDVDLVWICTPWEWHVRMATAAMEAGKDVALEVPAALTIAELDRLVNSARQTGRQCMMLENCCYDTWHLGIREMVRQGLLGRIKHLEGSYSHTVPEGWMRQQGRRHPGNPYPTHAIGPMCQLLAEDDRLDYLVSLSSPTPGDHTNTTLLHSVHGVSMMLHYDISTFRPYNRLQTVCGTLGFAQKYPLPTICMEKPTPLQLTGHDAEEYVESFIPQDFQELIAEGRRLGSTNLMNYSMDRRLIDTLEQNQLRRQQNLPLLPLDISIEDAAIWSSIIQLTDQSVQSGTTKIQIPKYLDI